MRLSHTLARMSVAFDDPNLVSASGLVPVLALAERAGLADLADEHLSVPTDKGANAGLKVASLVAGMVAGADSIDDMALLRHGGMGRVFARAYAPSTLGSFLRAFTFGHVRQLDAVAARFLLALAALLGLRPPPPDAGDVPEGTVMEQDKGAGELLDAGTPITITVAQATPPSPSPTPSVTPTPSTSPSPSGSPSPFPSASPSN